MLPLLLYRNIPNVHVLPCLVIQSCPTLYYPHGLQPARLLCPWNFPGKNTGAGLSFPTSGDLPNPGVEPRSPALQADSSQAEPPGKPKNTGMGGLSLLQEIFPTLELNWDLLQLQADSLPAELSGEHSNVHSTIQISDSISSTISSFPKL